MKKYITILIKNWLIITIIFVGIFLRFYRLDEIPAEIWGDIVVGMDFMTSVLRGEWPFYFILGNGPLYFYVASFSSLLLGFNFLTLKITSAFFGIVLIIGGYMFAKEVFNKEIGLITAFLLAVSKWPVIHSRWGLMNILVPTIISFIFYLLVRVIKKGASKDLIIIVFLAGIGLYVYPAFIIVPPTVVFIYSLLLICRKVKKISIKYYLISSVVFIVLSIPFLLKFSDFGFTKSDSYFGGKLFVTNGKLTDDFVKRLGDNLYKHLIMFNYRGDVVFRVNPANSPELDFISGIFMLVGLLYLIFSKVDFGKKLVILVPFVLFQAPSFLVINFPMDVPNSTRSIGILPFLYIIVSLGLYHSVKKFVASQKQLKLLLAIILFLIFLLNYKQVFMDYPEGLPDHNVPFGRMIAEKIDSLSYEVMPLVYSCCWGDWGQPEPGGIKYALKNARSIFFITNDADLCEFIVRSDKYYLFLDPRYEFFIKGGYLCNQKIRQEKVISKYGDVVYMGIWNY